MRDSCKETSSQFVKKKLQKRVDSVGCLWYSKDKSFENQYPYSALTLP